LVLVSEGYFQPYFYLVIPLSLLLVFKTQVSYSRWWEARCVFGNQQNELRNAARLVVAWIWPKDKNLGEDIVRLIAALAPACAAFIRHETRPLDANADLLTAKELHYVVSCKQPPVALGAIISKRLVAAPIETFERVAIEQNIVAFMSTLAPLIRLSTQPLYLTYTRVAVRMVILFLLGGCCCCCCCSLAYHRHHHHHHHLISRSYARCRPALRTLCLYGLDDGSRGSRDDHHVRDDREHGDPDREPAAGAAGGDPDGTC
jgi:predicted membrane chloride channel (bestrophin family)